MVCGGLVLAALVGMGHGAADKSPTFNDAVAPPLAVARVLSHNLDLVEQWLGEKDLASAAKSARDASTLCFLQTTYFPRFSDKKVVAAFGERTHSLKQATNALVEAATAQDDARARSALASSRKAVAGLERLRYPDPVAPAEGSRSVSIATKDSRNLVRSLMSLFDGTYADAKAADKLEDFEAFAYTLAEGANALGLLKADPRWGTMSADMRGAALAAAKESRQNLSGAQKTLRTVYVKCEACHTAYRR